MFTSDFRAEPKRNNINQQCTQRAPIRVDECSFEYSKAEDLPTYLLNESSIDQLIADIDLKKDTQEENGLVVK